jgi:hypothetical protein
MGTIVTPPLKKGAGGFLNTGKKSSLALLLRGGNFGPYMNDIKLYRVIDF